MSLDTEVKARLALLHAASGDTRTLRRVIHDHGDGLTAVGSTSLRARLRTMVRSAAVEGLVEQELQAAADAGARWLTPVEPEFPDALRRTDCPLICLRGEWPTTPLLAIVGARAADAYGREIAGALARAAASVGISVISGAADGIDQAAQDAAVDAGGRTIAVLGEGLSHRRSKEKSDKLQSYAISGAVMSERLVHAAGARWTYTDRNRLIAAAADAVVVVQAAERSGSLNTARHAREAERPLYAVPGDVCYASSAGPNRLLRTGEARILTHPADLIDVFPDATGLRSAGWPRGERGAGQPAAGRGLDVAADPGERLLALLRGGEPQGFDALAKVRADGDPPVAETLLDLELKGRIRRVDGNRFTAV